MGRNRNQIRWQRLHVAGSGDVGLSAEQWHGERGGPAHHLRSQRPQLYRCANQHWQRHLPERRADCVVDPATRRPGERDWPRLHYAWRYLEPHRCMGGLLQPEGHALLHGLV